MYRAMGDSNFAVERTNKEKAQEALANFVPPGYEQENPALTPDGALHVRYDLPAQTVHDEAARILQAMDLAGPADPASALSLTTRLGVTLRIEPVMESGCDLIITGIRGGSHEATGANFEAVQNLLQCLQERLPPAATEAEQEPRYAPAPRDEAWLLDIGGSLALLKGADFEVLTKYPEPTGFDVQIRRTFHDANAFITFARTLALPAPAPRKHVPASAGRPGGVISAHKEPRRSWILIALALLALGALFFYPWQQ